MEFRAVPNRANQPSLQEKFGENKIALSPSPPRLTRPRTRKASPPDHFSALCCVTRSSPTMLQAITDPARGRTAKARNNSA